MSHTWLNGYGFLRKWDWIKFLYVRYAHISVCPCISTFASDWSNHKNVNLAAQCTEISDVPGQLQVAGPWPAIQTR